MHLLKALDVSLVTHIDLLKVPRNLWRFLAAFNCAKLHLDFRFIDLNL
jgi:hypothetical protein